MPAASAAEVAVPPRARPVRSSASGPEHAWTVSTYQASAVPLARARAAPMRTMPAVSSQAVVPTPISVKATTLSAPAAARTGRRPRTSESPPVGSSSAATVSECAANSPAIAARDMPRSLNSRTIVARPRPGGSQRSAQTVT
ncbi:hypothetical protein HDC93_002493 [Streptomyces sp. AK010]|nr:hypothetical protein [Streptomyces sp. AK010]